jgi:L-arabinose isomerase
MLLAERLAGAALYAEWYASESASDTGLVLGAGEADPRWAADPGAITVRPATHAPGLVDRGWALGFEPRSGPATVLALGAAQDGWRLAWGTGTVSAGPPGLRGPAARLTLDGTDTLAAATRLIESGVTHHVVLAPGRLDVELPVVAACLGARTTQLSA